MGALKNFETEKADLKRTVKMLESLNRDHRIAIAASIDAYRRDELLAASSQPATTKNDE